MSKVHPKPLSAERLASAYEKLGFSEKKREFIHKFYKAAANLYGVALVDEVAAIYREYGKVIKENLYWSRQYVKNITWNDFQKYSIVAMRDDSLTYCFYDGDEIYDDCSDGERLVISKDIIGKGARRFAVLFDVIQSIHYDYPYYLPEDFLDYADFKQNPGFEEFRNFLSGLVSSVDKVFSPMIDGGKFVVRRPNENKGKRLDEIYITTKEDNFLEKGLGCGKFAWLPLAYQKALRDEQGKPWNCADKFARCIECDIKLSSIGIPEVLQSLINRLEDVGVEVDEDVFKELGQCFTYLNNNMRKYRMRGWTSTEVFKRNGPTENIVPKIESQIQEFLKDPDFDPEGLRQRIMIDKSFTLEAKQNLLEAIDQALRNNKK